MKAKPASEPLTTQHVELNRTCISLEAVQVRLCACEWLTRPLFLGPVLLLELGQPNNRLTVNNHIHDLDLDHD